MKACCLDFTQIILTVSCGMEEATINSLLKQRASLAFLGLASQITTMLLSE